MTTKVFGGDWFNPNKINLKKEAVLYNNFIPKDSMGDGLQILMAFSEPEAARCSNKSIIDNQNKFDLILTWETDVLNNCKNAILFNFGGCWTPNFKEDKKELAVSMLVGGRNNLDGHVLRHHVWYKKDVIKTKKYFYNSGNYPLGNEQPIYIHETKNKLFENISHHISIENVKKDGWFTEKLIDCFITKTIPIYWGCPDINKYFDARGIIICNTLDDIINAANNITMESYNRMLPYLETNYIKAIKYNQWVNPIEKRVGDSINDWIDFNSKEIN